MGLNTWIHYMDSQVIEATPSFSPRSILEEVYPYLVCPCHGNVQHITEVRVRGFPQFHIPRRADLLGHTHQATFFIGALATSASECGHISTSQVHLFITHT